MPGLDTPRTIKSEPLEIVGAWLAQSQTHVTADLEGYKFEPQFECRDYLNK